MSSIRVPGNCWASRSRKRPTCGWSASAATRSRDTMTLTRADRPRPSDNCASVMNSSISSKTAGQSELNSCTCTGAWSITLFAFAKTAVQQPRRARTPARHCRPDPAMQPSRRVAGRIFARQPATGLRRFEAFPALVQETVASHRFGLSVRSIGGGLCRKNQGLGLAASDSQPFVGQRLRRLPQPGNYFASDIA